MITKDEMRAFTDEWNELQDEIRKVWGMYLTEDGHFWGITDLMMKKIYEAEERGRQRAFQEWSKNLRQLKDDDES